MQLASQPLPFDAAELLKLSQVYELSTEAVWRITREIAAELGTEVYELTSEDMLHAGENHSFALPKGLEKFLGLPHGAVKLQDGELHGGGRGNKNTHEAKPSAAKLRATISNFNEVRAHFERYADPKYVSMLRNFV